MDQDNDLGPALLFCPGDRPERFAKAAATADQAVLDLEDGVLPDGKDAARAAVVAYLAEAGARAIVRINHPATPRGRADAAAIVAAGGRTLLLPKTQSRMEVDDILALRAGADRLRVVVTVETALGVRALPEILGQPGVTAVSWGPYDLAADMGLRSARDGAGQLLSPLAHARDQILLAAAAARTTVLDTVTAELRDPAILARDAEVAALFGMRGKFAIHPAQVDVIRRAFRPSAAEVERCRRLLAAVPAHGAFLFEGDMIDEPMLRRARRTLALAERADATAHA
ncbi:HpcH/HpaI aldolase/citrate lyase family protein [Chelatococcus reniformis]|uniref:CoA ester lyase n=1 Tax=Chelatococcus reniformis TaxID=1494448 RepID=A0A916ULV2_9HYPH|nr:CoA ester lyase [Chelatococcus reniformis]GGC78007.1 CoA ester lyase [Chelatococcus reniformis]